MSILALGRLIMQAKNSMMAYNIKTMTTHNFTNTKEQGLETLIYKAMTGLTGLPSSDSLMVKDEGNIGYGGTCWIAGIPENYDREYALDLNKLQQFLEITQPVSYTHLDVYKRQIMA